MIWLVLACMFVGGMVLLDERGRRWSPQSVAGMRLVLTVAGIVVAGVLDVAEVF